MLVGERRNGNLVVQLSPELQAQPVQLLRQRWNTDGYIEYLIRWAVENREKGGGNSGISSRTESKSSTILMWMSAEEVYTSCPTLLGNQKPKEPGHFEEKTSGGPAEGPLQEMTEDVRMLVQRATRQMAQSSAPNSSILNTIHVLSAYANIDSLAGVFKETGALDLLMKMLCNPEKQICKNAGKMLRALASHDAGSRAHVLLSLSQQDGIAQHMDFESRYTLLQLFAETTSSEEHCISFDGIHLPQIPGKQLFSLVKRYLCVTSLLDQLSSDQPDRNNEIRLQHLFDFSMAMGSLICELVRVMGWVNEQTSDVDVCRDYDQPRVLRSIFQPKVPSCSTFHTAVNAPLHATATKKKSVKEFMSPSDFESHNDYVDYIQGALKPGMSVRMLEDYDEISAGDEGVFRQSNNGMPPVQVHWQRLGCTYWVQWDMLEIVNSNVEMRERKNITALTAEPVTPALHWTTSRRTDPIRSLKTVTELIRQDEWWEILFFIRQLDHEGHQKVMEVIREKLELLGQDMDTLRQVSVSVDAAQDIVSFLSDHCQGFLLSDLQRSHIYKKFFLHIVPGKRHNARSYSSVFKTSKWQSVVSEFSETLGNADQSNDLQMLKTLLRLEGLQLPDAADEKRTRENSDPEAEIKSSLESCRAMVHHVCHDRISTGLNVTQEHPEHSESKSVPGKSSLSENTVKMLVELLTSEMKEKLLVVTCLQLTYVVMSKYDWRVLFATEGGVRAVLGCMQEHQSSAAVQHIGLAVLKVLTGTGCCDLRGSSRRYTLNPSDVQVIKEIFSSIGSAASASSISLLRAIPGAIGKMLSTPGCFTSVHNGLLVVRMLTDNHQGLSEQLSRCELPSVLQSVSEDSSNSMSALQRHILSLLIHNCMSELSTGTSHIYSAESAQVLILQEMDLPALLSSLKDGQMCQELLPSLERCVFDDVSSLRCDVSQLLTDPNFFLQLLSSLEQLRSEKHLQLCVYRIMNKALHLYREDTVPWHKSIRPSLNALGAYSSEKEVVQVVIGFLYNLASTSKDCAVVMCCLDTKDALNKVMEKHSSDLQQAADLKDLLTSCEKYAGLHQKMATTVLAGCIQMVLGQIEEHRRSQLQINIPFLDVFLRNLHQGSETEHKEVKCWEKLEVSSNPYCAYKLTDGNPKSYWQSRGNSGSHFITIYLLQGVEIRQLVLIVASEDSSYMPAQVEVMGGENVSCINMELNTVNISSAAGRVVLLENVTRFWPIIQVKIKRCQQGGIDTRVRGLEVLGPKPTFWPVFKEQLCRRTFLFYTSRAHSWGQEICDKKEHLLQLFGRLNRALSHEQEFAERFLPDDEAAQALGRMCWEALITPLVQSITTSDSEGVSSLSWLLTRYLENIQVSRRPKSRTSVFNPRVRRLTHLLVHVDNSPPDTVELKPPSKINGKSRDSSSVCVKVTSPGLSSMAGIAQCWQGVVQKQVQRFLEVSWNDVDLVPRFCSLYLSLRRAMEEMFGQQTRFLLSLRQGFCEGLLQLSFLTAIHVTEQFARYINQQIIVICIDSSDLQSLEHLQQFLEFVLFLSELELANSFEHFYRHYLANRLLTLGPCWLENSVVDHIGICFPNRFPQEMLKNLQEANILQIEEHLFRLQELDEDLLSEEDEMIAEVMEGDQCQKENRTEVEICVLSSQCWPFSPVCYMDNPHKYFLHSLTDSLQSFTDVYTKSQSVLDSRSQRLQWTWLGTAEIQYGDLTLRVSTLQMFILLLFNQQKEVSEKDIVDRTGVSDSLLRNSLLPLTADSGILTVHETTRRLCLNETALSDRQMEALLNLSPKQTYMSDSERSICALKEKRDFLSHIISQVMKEEREIHVDLLVFRVMESCQKQEDTLFLLSPSHKYVATDVLSCIMRQLRDGKIQKKQSDPLILCYKVENPPRPAFYPITPHTNNVMNIPPQVSEFCRVQKVTSNIAPVQENRPTFSTFKNTEKP